MESLLAQFAPKLCGIVTTLVIPLFHEVGESAQRAPANHTGSFGKTASALPAPHRAAGIRRNCIRQPFGKNPLGATMCFAEESPSVEDHLNRNAVSRQIGELAFIAAMDACGRRTTARTYCLRASDVHQQPDSAAIASN
jgi:hypothetical protein